MNSMLQIWGSSPVSVSANIATLKDFSYENILF